MIWFAKDKELWTSTLTANQIKQLTRFLILRDVCKFLSAALLIIPHTIAPNEKQQRAEIT